MPRVVTGPRASRSVRTVKVDVKLRAGQKLVITKKGETVVKGNSNTIRRPLWAQWVHLCGEKHIPRDMWPSKWAPQQQTDYLSPMKVPVEWKPIEQMHTMQLVRSIRWCIRQAGYWITKAGSSLEGRAFTMTLPEVLAQSPQWSGLLVEAEKRKLDIIVYFGGSFAPWYEECKKAAVLKALQS